MMDKVKRPHITEKSMDLMDFENKMQFVCSPEATKTEIAGEIEDTFDVEVADVNTQVTMKGEKKATVRFSEDGVAQNLASRMGAF